MVNAERERELNQKELKFLSRHREACEDCFEYEESLTSSLSFLRSSALEPEALSDEFTWRVARKARLVQQRDSIRYWSPAFLGAAVACLVLLAALQLAERSNPVNMPVTTAQRKAEHNFQASVVPYESAESSSDVQDSRDLRSRVNLSGDGPLLLVRPKTTRSIDFEP